jgi:hypothetical protein
VSSFTPQMQAALAAPQVTVFGAVELLLPGHALRLIEGAGRVQFGDGRVFTGLDATFGAIDAIDVISDGAGDEAPEVTLTLTPAGDAAAGVLASAAMQGAQASLYLGAIDPISGLVIPDPLLVFLGEVDVPTMRSGPEGRRVEYSIVSVFERFFSDDEGARLSDTFHRSVWPGETGLAGVTGVDKPIYWGVEGPRSASITYGSGGGGRGFRDALNAVF